MSFADYGDRMATGTGGGHPAPIDRRPHALAELFGLVLWFLLFSRLHEMAGRDAATATANAATVRSLEGVLHLDIELGVNRRLAGHHALSLAAMYFYRLYYVVILGVLLWVFLRHAGAYRRVRRTMIAMTVLVLPVYRAVPLSPPRFTLPGAVDVVARHDILGDASLDTGSGLSYTAMPSMHTGWSLWCAWAVWLVLRRRHPRGALLAWLFPLLMAVTVVATANHYVLDLAGSVTLLAVAVAVGAWSGRLFRRRRPVTVWPAGWRRCSRWKALTRTPGDGVSWWYDSEDIYVYRYSLPILNQRIVMR